jgi:hypothetical protein
MAVALAALVAASPRAVAAGAEFGLVVTKEKTALEGYARVEVWASVEDAEVYINRSKVGLVPFEAPRLAPGHYLFGVSAPGHYWAETEIDLEEKTSYLLEFALVRIVGYLSISVSPADAQIYVDDERVSAGIIQLPIGEREVRVSRFGYEGAAETVYIREGSTSALEVELESAAFEVSGLSASRSSFNPGNAGFLGRSTISFEVSSYGSGRMRILDPDGAMVAERLFPRFETWRQSATWDGRGPDGKPLRDGAYRVLLEASPAPGVELARPDRESGGDGVKIRYEGGLALGELAVALDSSIRIRPSGSVSAVPGLVFFPDPAPQAAGATLLELGWHFPASSFSSGAAAFSAALSLADMFVLSASAAAEIGSGSSGEIDLAASLLCSVAKAGPLRASAFLRCAYSGAAEPLLPGAAGRLELGAPIALVAGLGRDGGIEAAFGLAPALAIDPFAGSLSLLAIVRGGLWLSTPSWRIGASGELPVAGGIALSETQVCLEAALLLAPSAFVVSGRLVAAPFAAPGQGTTPPVIGLGLGFLL